MKVFQTISILLLLTLSCSNQKIENPSGDLKTEIDTYITQTMELHNIPGLALAVIEDGNVVYENYFGKASLENQKPVDKNTLFRIFSATKLITATAVFQLIQAGKLNLDDKVSKYLVNLPNAWKEIEIKNLLSHSSGLPDLIRYKSTLTDQELMEKLSTAKMEFVTGNEFRYNQTNYWLLAQIIEEITGMTFDQYILANQFDKATNGVLFSSNSQEIIPQRATRYFYNNKTKTFEKDTNNDGKRAHAGNGLNISLKAFIEWNRALDENELLDEKTKAKMWTPFPFTNQKDDFLYGWGNFSVATLNSYGFSGGNLAAFRKFVDHNTTIILLSNGYEIPAYDIIIDDIARIAISVLRIKDLALEENVMSSILNGQLDQAAQYFKKLKEENPNSKFDNLKWNINSIGNNYLYGEGNNEKALQVFQFNAKANPNWWVATAGLAEAYELQKDTLQALENYQKAIELNESNEWAYNDQMNKKVSELEGR